MQLNELVKKISMTTDAKEILYLRGKLIKLIKKEIKNNKDSIQVEKFNIMLYDELKKHKDHIALMKKSKNVDNNSISEKLALMVKDISTTIEVFMQKKDVFGKIKNSIISGVTSSLYGTAILFGINIVTGAPCSIAMLASLIPTTCYFGLSGILTALLKKTNKSLMLEKYDKSPDELIKEIQFCEKFIVNNTRFIQLSLNEKKITDLKEKIENEKQLIEEYNKIIDNAPNEDVRKNVLVEMLETMKKLDNNYMIVNNELANDRIKMSEDEYKKFALDMKKLKNDIFVKDLFFKETSMAVAKNVVKGSAIMYASQIILSSLFPSLKYVSFSDALIPLIHNLLTNIMSLGDISKSVKMVKSSYINKVIEVSHPELFEQALIENNSPVKVM